MYDPADVRPGRLEPGELDRMAPWFALTQQANPDFSRWQETAYANHGFSSHRVAEDQLRRDIAIYYGMISLVDGQVARILRRLDDLGVAENTIVIFTTDHGHFLGHHGLTAKGAFHYEDLLRVPLHVRWPGRVPAGSRSESLQSLVDLAPTILAAAGLPAPQAMQGVNQLPVWTGAAADARDHVIVENRHQPTAVHLRTYIEQRHKLTVYRGQPWGDLFDLAEDPGEIVNRYDDPAYATVRHDLALRALDYELQREASRYERIAVA
jgi:arylsulfatase A-like enzyme